MTAHEVKKIFNSQISQSCVVIETAVYPAKGKNLDLSLADFTLRILGTRTSASPASPRMILATLDGKAPRKARPDVQGEVGIETGTETVTDANSGQTRRGRATTISEAVGIAMGGPAPLPTKPDHNPLEDELRERSLPAGPTSKPVAGFLYFAVSRTGEKAAYRLEYVVKGGKLSLTLP